jgi:hypothetical protein
MILDTERVVMEPREFAGSMTRLVDYAADIVGVGYALQYTHRNLLTHTYHTC